MNNELVRARSHDVGGNKVETVYSLIGYSTLNEITSVLKGIDDDGLAIRSELLSSLNNALEHQISSLNRKNRFYEIEKSLLWSSVLAEKSTMKSTAFIDMAKIIYLRKEILLKSYKSIFYEGSNKNFSISLNKICNELGVNYSCNLGSNSYIFNAPIALKALFRIYSYTTKYWGLKNNNKNNLIKSDSLFIFDYILSDINKSNYHFSNYWKNLICKIEENKLNINWGFFFLPKNKGDADLAIKNIKNCKNIHRNSIFIHGFISYAIVIKVITLWFLLQVRWLFIGVQRLSNLNKYWYGVLLEGDLKKAYCGPEAVTNLFEIYLFSSLLKSIPRQNKGLFLMENLGWEKSLIYFWKKYGHGDLIGCPHTIIRFWDLRYFGDTMKEKSLVLSEIPQPDKIAVNGPTSLKMLNQGYQSNKLIPVEAQRYEHLLDVKHKFMDFNEIQTILIVGDISINNSDLMVREIANHHVFFNGKYKLIYKPHPAISSHTIKIKKLNYDISHDDIKKLLRVANIVICSTYTSVAIDARYLGIPVINFLNKNDFNMSPFRDSNDDFNVDNGVDIVKIISSLNFKNIKKLRENSFFWLSSDYKLWIKALKNE